MLQHSPSPPQGKPSTLHADMPQRPFAQTPLQHSSGDMQGKPSAWHWLKPQVKMFGSQKLVQHEKPFLQGAPSGKQLFGWQVLNSQSPEQQS